MLRNFFNFGGKGVDKPALRFSPQNTAFDAAILAAGLNASISYLVEPYLADRRWRSVLVDSRRGDLTDVDVGCVVVVRYLSDNWVLRLREFKRQGGKIIYFMDDDLMDEAALRILPQQYRKKIRLEAIRKRHILEEICDEFWVASPYLANKYATWEPVIVSPRAQNDCLGTSTPHFSICYHGTASHVEEIEWLVPIIAHLQSKFDDTTFEIFGDRVVNKLYRGIPRTSVLHPMDWTNYLAYTIATTRDVALAPLLPSMFNLARGPTKFFDFTRMGAVGIYSGTGPYAEFVRDRIDGILLPNECEAWIDAIASLRGDPDLRKWMVINARNRVKGMANGCQVFSDS